MPPALRRRLACCMGMISSVPAEVENSSGAAAKRAVVRRTAAGKNANVFMMPIVQRASVRSPLYKAEGSCPWSLAISRRPRRMGGACFSLPGERSSASAGGSPPAPLMLRVHQLPHAAIGHGHEVAYFLAGVHLARTRDLGVGVLQHFLPLRQPADGARNAEQHGELIRGETHRLVDDTRVEIHVGVELAFDEVLVREGDLLQCQGDIDLGMAARHLEDFLGALFEDARARVVVLIDAVPEAHQLALAVLHFLDVTRNVDRKSIV